MIQELRKTVWRRATSLFVCLAMVATLAMAVPTNALGAGEFFVTRGLGTLVGAYNTLELAVNAVNSSVKSEVYTIEFETLSYSVSYIFTL
jgi:hypothetical protein